jgi:uncharacterized membrane protein
MTIFWYFYIGAAVIFLGMWLYQCVKKSDTQTEMLALSAFGFLLMTVWPLTIFIGILLSLWKHFHPDKKEAK